MQRKTVKISLLLIAISLSIFIPMFAVSVTAKKQGYTSGPVYIDDSIPQFSWVAWSAQPWLKGSGTEEDPYMIKDLTIDVDRSFFALMITNSDAYFKIMKCEFSNGGIEDERTAGLLLVNAQNGVIFKNQLTDNDGSGIALIGSQNNKIQKNLLTQNGVGIYLEWSMFNTIKQNDVKNNFVSGIVIASSHKTIVENNDCAGNVEAGITLINVNTADPDPEHDPKDNIIYANNLESNQLGIYLSNADKNDVLMNTIAENFYGILIVSGSEENTVYHNNFVDNVVQSIDYQPWTNSWHHPYMLEGNYWSNYLGMDENEDGIGDTPHGHDGYPIMEENSWEVMTPIEEEISDPLLPNRLGGGREVNPNETSYIRYGVLQLFSERINGEAYPPYTVRINGVEVIDSVFIFQDETSYGEPGLMQLYYIKIPPYYLTEVLGLTPGYYEYEVEICWFDYGEQTVFAFTTGYTII